MSLYFQKNNNPLSNAVKATVKRAHLSSSTPFLLGLYDYGAPTRKEGIASLDEGTSLLGFETGIPVVSVGTLGTKPTSLLWTWGGTPGPVQDSHPVQMLTPQERGHGHAMRQILGVGPVRSEHRSGLLMW
jgi:hypothetical protein